MTLISRIKSACRRSVFQGRAPVLLDGVVLEDARSALDAHGGYEHEGGIMMGSKFYDLMVRPKGSPVASEKEAHLLVLWQQEGN